MKITDEHVIAAGKSLFGADYRKPAEDGPKHLHSSWSRLRAALEAALSQAEPAGVAGREGADKREQLRQEVLRLFKANKMANDESLANLIADYFAALSPAPAGVQVKALEWEQSIAGAPFGDYRIHSDRDNCFYWSLDHADGEERLPTLEAAKSAAQADYESRIRSALIAPPAAGARAVPSGWQSCDTLPEGDDVIVEIQVRENVQKWNAARFRKSFDGDVRDFVWRYPVPSSPVGEER